MTAPDVAARVTAWLDRLEGLHTAATPGPWIVWHAPDILAIGAGHTMVRGVPGNPTEWVGAGHTPADAAAIVAEHNALPALLALARGVAALADYWDAEAKRLRDQATDLRRHRFPDSARLRDEEATDLEDRATRLRRLLADAAPDTGEETA